MKYTKVLMILNIFGTSRLFFITFTNPHNRVKANGIKAGKIFCALFDLQRFTLKTSRLYSNLLGCSRPTSTLGNHHLSDRQSHSIEQRYGCVPYAIKRLFYGKQKHSECGRKERSTISSGTTCRRIHFTHICIWPCLLDFFQNLPSLKRIKILFESG